MAKRFGRNQRRRMRQQIDELDKAFQLQTALIRHLRLKNEQDADTIRQVAAVLGKHFAGLPAESTLVSNVISVLQIPTYRQEELLSSLDNDLASRVSYTLNTLDVYWAELRGDELSHQQHVIVSTPTGRVGYQ